MVERISSGQTSALRGQATEKTHADKDGGKGAKATALGKRQAVREHGAQLRTHKQQVATKKGGQTFFQRYFGKKTLSPEQVKKQERTERRQRLQQQGPKLEQHKKNAFEARATHARDVQEKKNTIEARTTHTRDGQEKKQGVEVVAFKQDENRLRDRLGALDAYVKHTAEGKAVRFVDPKPTLQQRSALLLEGRRSFFGQAGAKFKDMMLHVFRPQKWQARQVALSEARKAELALVRHNHDRQMAALREADKKIAADHKDMEAIHKRSLEDSVEKPKAVSGHLAEKLTYKSDPELLKNPDYVRERVQRLEEIAQKRQETESAAIAKTRAKLDEQQRVAKGEAPSDTQPVAAPRAAPRVASRAPRETKL